MVDDNNYRDDFAVLPKSGAVIAPSTWEVGASIIIQWR